MSSNNISIVSVTLPYKHSLWRNSSGAYCASFMQVFSPRTAVNQAIYSRHFLSQFLNILGVGIQRDVCKIFILSTI